MILLYLYIDSEIMLRVLRLLDEDKRIRAFFNYNLKQNELTLKI